MIKLKLLLSLAEDWTSALIAALDTKESLVVRLNAE